MVSRAMTIIPQEMLDLEAKRDKDIGLIPDNRADIKKALPVRRAMKARSAILNMQKAYPNDESKGWTPLSYRNTRMLMIPLQAPICTPPEMKSITVGKRNKPTNAYLVIGTKKHSSARTTILLMLRLMTTWPTTTP